ncbi:prophage regulatory protein-like protein (plasmid) [Legionella adelaidensis]|uniref:Prophage regulatory protein-like protein n=1 Tax=Legionella adelaidensis TaxID=45056 RepID=A0A0W0R5I4_9GAMM|nr:AlpA family phage regulatory protein [Legionella adelaidensis]KTC66342.1 prophage regulatory protein-like protein [Legionella adelaidensis]VEH84940.1 prophage regulatory protein-like protein [Legionella adelaidensis]
MQPLNNLFSQQILFINDLETIIGKDRLTLRRWWTDGKFPLPVKLHGRTLAWHKEVIDEWINQNMKKSIIKI